MNTKYGTWVTYAIGIVTIVLTLSACGRSQGDGKTAPGAPEVAVVTVKPERVAIITELPGRTSTYMIAEVRPQVTGIIQKRFFAEGADVKAGDVLYQIDPATYEAAYAQAKAMLARSEANILSIRTRSERYKELVAINAVSRQDYDDVLAALQQAEADIEAGKAAVQTARINLAYTRVTAPISGRTGKSNVTVGALVTTNQPTPLTVVQQLDPIYVDATQSSANLLRIKNSIAAGRIRSDGPGQTRVKLLLEDGTPYPQEGVLKFSDVTVDASTGSYVLRMIFPNPKHTLLPNMYVRALVQEGVAEQGILVPQQGVSRDPKGDPVVLIVDAENKVQARKISLFDRAVGDKWLAASGVAPGDRVIVEGSQKVRPGVPVKVVPFDGGRKEGPEAPKTSEAPAKAK